MPRNATGSNMALSFIDVLASALGAAVLLFVVLAATPPVPSIGHAEIEGTFIRYEWSVDDPNALMRISIEKDQASAAAGFLDLQDLRGPLVVHCPSNIRGLSSYLLMGFAAGAETGSKGRTFVLRLNKPAPGSWKVGIMYYQRSDDMSSGPKPVNITAKVESDSSTVPAAGATRLTAEGNSTVVGEHAQLGFGDQYLSPVVVETAPQSKDCKSRAR